MQFYFPQGKPVSKDEKQSGETSIQKAFEGKSDVNIDDFDQICSDVLKIPKIFKKLAFDRIKETEKLDSKLEKIPK